MKKILLKNISTKPPRGADKVDMLIKTAKMREEIIALQQKFFADGKHALLLILQGMDASGKDGVVRHVFEGVNPAGIQVHSWGKPTVEEYAHDYLWRLHKVAPKKGIITIWNRSQYEDILVPSVMGYVDKKIVAKRYEHINDFERMLTDEGTTVVKCYLNMSKDVQLERLEERMLEKEKFFKVKSGDYDTRAKWDEYMAVYQDILDRTHTDYAPWHIVPVDAKWYKVYTVTKLLLDTLKSLPLQWPKLDTTDVPASILADVAARKADTKKNDIQKKTGVGTKTKNTGTSIAKYISKKEKKTEKNIQKVAKKTMKMVKKMTKKDMSEMDDMVQAMSSMTRANTVKKIPTSVTKKSIAKKSVPIKKVSTPAVRTAKKIPSTKVSISTQKAGTTKKVAKPTTKTPTTKKVPVKKLSTPAVKVGTTSKSTAKKVARK